MLMNAAGKEGAKAIEELLQHNTTIRFVDLRENRVPPPSKQALEAIAAQCSKKSVFKSIGIGID